MSANSASLPSSSTTLTSNTSTTTSSHNNNNNNNSSSPSAVSKKWLGILDQVVDSVVIRLHRRDIRGSGVVAIQTAELLRTVIAKGRFTSVTQLLEQIRSVGKRLSDAQPIELSIGNIVRRVLHIVRHECAAAQKEEEQARQDGNHNQEDGHKKQQQQVNIDLSLSLHKLLDAPHASTSAAPAYLQLSTATIVDLKQPITEEISLLMEEIKTGEATIAEQAIEHIYAKEVIMTFGISKTVVAFLKEAAKFRKFEVVVAESAPSYEGQKMAVILAEAGIETTVITDSAVFAVMPSVNKVIVGTHGVMANGGLIAHTGAHNIAVAAAHHSVPFVVVTGLHKLCPLYAFDQDTFNEHNAPSQILKFEEAFAEHVDVSNPAFDYVAPELINLFITNFGGHNPSYIYRLLAEYYDPQDYKL